MKLNFKFTTTAAFLISALLFAGCAGNAAPEESMPPESVSPAPFSDTTISSGIQTGKDAEAAAALLGDWDLDKAEVRTIGARPDELGVKRHHARRPSKGACLVELRRGADDWRHVHVFSAPAISCGLRSDGASRRAGSRRRR